MIKRLTSYRCSRLAVVTVTMAMQAVVAAIGASPAFANYPYFVNTLADNVTSDGVCTLREAMFAANNNPITGDCGPGSPEFDTIFIFVPGTIVLEGKLPDITEGLAILGRDPGGTTIDANGRARAFVINSSGPLLGFDVRLERLTITNAKASDGSVASPRGEDGGAIHNSGRLDLRDVRITHSAAGNGLTSAGNGGHGGAIYNAGGIVGYRVTFDNNSAGWGGSDNGINFSRGGSGGAIYNAAGAALILYGATLMKNAEGRDLGFGAGAAVYTRGPAVIKSSTFLRNGGIFTQFASTITAEGSGQVLLSTTIMDNLCEGSFIDGGYNVFITGTNCPLAPNSGSIKLPWAELFDMELRNNGGFVPTAALPPTSPALDRVPALFEDCADGMLVNRGLPFQLSDARGVDRPQNGACDVGAFEIGPSFRRGVRTLAITGAGTGQGNVSGDGLDCVLAGGATSGQCSSEYDHGTVVSPTATAAAGSIFVGWEGDPECADGSVLMDGDKHCTAIFDLRPLSIRGAASLSDSGSATRLGKAHSPNSEGSVAVTFDAEFAFAGAIDLGSATVTINALLNEEGERGAGELIEGVPIVLQAIPGGGSTAAIFETPSSVAPRVTVEVQIAQPALSVAIAIEGATLARFPELCATSTPSATTLTTTFTIDDGVNPPLTVTAKEPWRCLAPTAGDRLLPRLLRTQ